MQISPATFRPALSVPQSLLSFATPQVSADPTETVLLQGTAPTDATNSTDRKKAYKNVAWAGFGVEMVGGALTLAGHGGIGLTLFAGGAALMLYGEYKAQRA